LRTVHKVNEIAGGLHAFAHSSHRESFARSQEASTRSWFDTSP
jgi:hypothetical protein